MLEDDKYWGRGEGGVELGKGEQEYRGKVFHLKGDGQSRLHSEVVFSQNPQEERE